MFISFTSAFAAADLTTFSTISAPFPGVTNIAREIDRLKERGLWIGACDMDGEVYCSQDLTGSIGIVIGSEGFGISRLVREKCDFVVSIPMKGRITSLNASNAASILMYEIVRQRLAEQG